MVQASRGLAWSWASVMFADDRVLLRVVGAGQGHRNSRGCFFGAAEDLRRIVFDRVGNRRWASARAWLFTELQAAD